MRVAVVHAFGVQQRAVLAQRVGDAAAGVVDVLPRKQRRGRQVPAVAVDRAVQRQVVRNPHRKIFMTVPGRGMHGAGARLGGHVLAEHHRHDAVEERMPEFQPLERCAGRRTHH